MISHIIDHLQKSSSSSSTSGTSTSDSSSDSSGSGSGSGTSSSSLVPCDQEWCSYRSRTFTFITGGTTVNYLDTNPSVFFIDGEAAGNYHSFCN
jgi:hypothetical protein